MARLEAGHVQALPFWTRVAHPASSNADKVQSAGFKQLLHVGLAHVGAPGSHVADVVVPQCGYREDVRRASGIWKGRAELSDVNWRFAAIPQLTCGQTLAVLARESLQAAPHVKAEALKECDAGSKPTFCPTQPPGPVNVVVVVAIAIVLVELVVVL
eukprot:CAMPEP_0117493106 /NCGR_PEP_ID=MMETSP0784-20121206/18928_1 /TAXON_ID=39447 /ORGANISM="" /LENGTH=156 /DNA_ID=CAMNT_0005287951 /DNA_START=182 /DNA_END=651 /DNA_ORIENTATION=-